MNGILWPSEVSGARVAGGKAAALAMLMNAGFRVPPWFVVQPGLFLRTLVPAERRRFAEARRTQRPFVLSESVQSPVALCSELSRAIETTRDGRSLAVRSSAREEDGARHSYAGQLDSFLDVTPAEVADRIAAVWSSAYSERVTAYRRQHGLALPGDPPAVLVQRMLAPRASGIAFSADPVSGARRTAVVVATAGLGDALAAGRIDGAIWRVDRDGTIIDHRPAAGEPAPQLDARVIAEIAALARRAAAEFGSPQDIEWAIDDGVVQLLQARPITTLAKLGDPDGALLLWDNSNIIESYSGITLPLTFSFARNAYAHVYRRFCEVVGVTASDVAAHADLFPRMLGLIRGRVYYNLLNWYRLVALLPGYRFNRRAMEQMMGVREPLSPPTAPAAGRNLDRLRDGWRMARGIGALLSWQFTLPRRVRRFHARVEAALRAPDPPLASREPEELAAHYRELEQRLLANWDVPIVNDLFTMIWNGVLRRLTNSWLDAPHLYTAMVACGGDVRSTLPVQGLRELADIAARDPEFADLLLNGSLQAITGALPAHGDFDGRYRSYLEEFGDRCFEELKLESPNVREAPLPVLRAIGALSRIDRACASAAAAKPAADADAIAALDVLRRRSMFRWLVLRWVARQARARIRARESLRFERTRVFGRMRAIVRSWGHEFAARELIAAADDICYLELGEILGFIDGTATCTDLRSLVSIRRAEFDAYRAAPAPANRFTTRGIVHHDNDCAGNDCEPAPAEGVAGQGDTRYGTGCSAGRARGRVSVIDDPRTQQPDRGDIVIARHTDPGWVTVLPLAAGLVVERGSPLSHSAIIARELGIPAVVSLPDATSWLRNGDEVEIDGASGEVRRLGRSAEPAAMVGA